MPIVIDLLVLLLVFSIVYWITTLIPMPPPVRSAVNIVIGVLMIVTLLSAVRIVPGLRLHRY